LFKFFSMTHDVDAVSYCVGMSLAGSLMQQNLEGLNGDKIGEAIQDVFGGNQPKFAPDEAEGMIQNYLRDTSEAKFAVNKEAGQKFLEENGAKDNVVTTDSGLQYEVIAEGAGDKPSSTSTVTVHYHGTLIDGTVFDSSVERGQPASFGVNQVIRGWTEALQLMSAGSKYRLYIPEHLAYGASPHPGGPIEPYMALIFDVELLEIA